MIDLMSAESVGAAAVAVPTAGLSVWAAIKWLGARMIDQHDKLADRVNKLERDYVTRKELGELREELSRNNRDTQSRLDQILRLLISRTGKGEG